MKNVLKSLRFFISTLVIVAIALTVSVNTWAEEESQEEGVPVDKMAQLEAQIKTLMDFKQNVENYNPNIDPLDDLTNPDFGPQQAGGEGTQLPPGACYADHKDWPSSGTYNESDWDLQKLAFDSANGVQLQDLNGDGLVDSFMKSKSGTLLATCVFLNNGRGWDLTHKCYGTKNDNQVWTFYGDCAQQ